MTDPYDPLKRLFEAIGAEFLNPDGKGEDRRAMRFRNQRSRDKMFDHNWDASQAREAHYLAEKDRWFDEQQQADRRALAFAALDADEALARQWLSRTHDQLGLVPPSPLPATRFEYLDESTGDRIILLPRDPASDRFGRSIRFVRGNDGRAIQPLFIDSAFALICRTPIELDLGGSMARLLSAAIGGEPNRPLLALNAEFFGDDGRIVEGNALVDHLAGKA